MLVQLTCYEMDDQVAIENMMQVIGDYLSRSPGLPDNVFIMYYVARAGQVFAQGQVVK